MNGYHAVILILVLLIVLVGIFLAFNYTIDYIKVSTDGFEIDVDPPPTSVEAIAGPTSAPIEQPLPVTPTNDAGREQPLPVTPTTSGGETQLMPTNVGYGGSDRRLIFESIRYDTDHSGGIDFDDNRALVMTDIRTSEMTWLTDSDYNARDVSWSPDGLSIVFASDRDGDFDIYLMSPLGAPWQQIVQNDGYMDRGPSWSPDGQWIAFYSDRDGDTEIYRMRANGSDVQQLTHNQIEDEYPVWYPDANLIYYQSGQECPIGDCQIYIMSADGQNQQVLLDRQSYWPSWSPDRRYFGASLVGEKSKANICIWDMQDGTEKMLAGDSSTAQSWSADSQQIAYAMWVDRAPQVWLMNNDFSANRQLTSIGWNTRPVFAP